MSKATYLAKLILILCMAISGIAVLKTVYLPAAGQSLENFWSVLSLLLIWHWFYYDALDQNFHRPFSFGMHLQVFWWLYAPYYLLATRGIKGVLLGFGFLFAMILPTLIREFGNVV